MADAYPRNTKSCTDLWMRCRRPQILSRKPGVTPGERKEPETVVLNMFAMSCLHRQSSLTQSLEEYNSGTSILEFQPQRSLLASVFVSGIFNIYACTKRSHSQIRVPRKFQANWNEQLVLRSFQRDFVYVPANVVQHPIDLWSLVATKIDVKPYLARRLWYCGQKNFDEVM